MYVEKAVASFVGSLFTSPRKCIAPVKPDKPPVCSYTNAATAAVVGKLALLLFNVIEVSTPFPAAAATSLSVKILFDVALYVVLNTYSVVSLTTQYSFSSKVKLITAPAEHLKLPTTVFAATLPTASVIPLSTVLPLVNFT